MSAAEGSLLCINYFSGCVIAGRCKTIRFVYPFRIHIGILSLLYIKINVDYQNVRVFDSPCKAFDFDDVIQVPTCLLRFLKFYRGSH